MRAAKAGIKVELPTDGDVTMSLANHRFFVECKRPRTLNSLKRNFEKASRAGTKRTSRAEDRSLVVVDASLAINPTFHIRKTNLSKQNLYHRAHKWLRGMTEEDGRRVNGITDLSHTGILTRYSSFSIAAGEMFHVQVWAAYPNMRIGAHTKESLVELVQLLDPSYTQSFSFVTSN
jgi:hypothetical protein